MSEQLKFTVPDECDKMLAKNFLRKKRGIFSYIG